MIKLTRSLTQFHKTVKFVTSVVVQCRSVISSGDCFKNNAHASRAGFVQNARELNSIFTADQLFFG